MKKRKTPIMLVSFLVVLLGSAAFINGFISESNKTPEQLQKEDMERQKKGVETKVSRQELVDAVGTGLAKGEEVMANKRSGSSLVKKSNKDYKPQLNENNVSSRWFDEESAIANKKKGKG